ncbi:unnamed protein product, partial [Gongylonema pulchrum]|uniref:THAP-type domain-containing protein n=1 Tax=Gongylonema pulchrum TaxID=637853 RepID=A0A183F137_9BILA
MEKCVFCGWYRRTDDPGVKFYAVPREPGLKRVKWLCAIGERQLTPRDKVCSIHFRLGRPSNDPSHIDFAPHLCLDSRRQQQPPVTTLSFLQRFADDDEDLLVGLYLLQRLDKIKTAAQTAKAQFVLGVAVFMEQHELLYTDTLRDIDGIIGVSKMRDEAVTL